MNHSGYIGVSEFPVPSLNHTSNTCVLNDIRSKVLFRLHLTKIRMLPVNAGYLFPLSNCGNVWQEFCLTNLLH